ncbi:lumican-like [Heterodontus francisci]|uniref:lumican-like n=1 Tax=Heterodontus francisci TaxID=7792 RepID=UPI00355ADF2D
MALNFFTSGSSQGSHADLGGISQTAAHHYISQITDALFVRAGEYIQFQTDVASQAEREIIGQKRASSCRRWHFTSGGCLCHQSPESLYNYLPCILKEAFYELHKTIFQGASFEPKVVLSHGSLKGNQPKIGTESKKETLGQVTKSLVKERQGVTGFLKKNCMTIVLQKLQPDYGGIPVLFNNEEGDPTVLSLSGRITSDYFRYFGIEDYPLECDCLIHWPTAMFCDNRALLYVPLMLPFRSQYLYIQGNCIQHLPEGGFKNTTALKWMILDRNNISSKNIGKDVFCSLNQLENLYMNYNNLIEVPAQLPRSLKQLRLAHNRFKKLSQEPFENLENLVMLLLHGNQLTTINGGDMKGLKSLIHLDLSYQLTVFPKNLPVTIQQLYCTNNFFETLTEDYFAQFHRLLYLRLSHNKFTIKGLAPNSFNISTLIELGLSYNNLTSIPHVHKNLRYH